MSLRLCLVGFDSAWADNPGQPGAIAAAIPGAARIEEVLPQLASFTEAAALIEGWAAQADLTLIALDQPTIVPNATGMRPVEKVAGSVVNAIGGGVQPANRGRAAMFGDAAPVWRFLQRIGARQNPPAARMATAGRFVIEVFPALMLASWLPQGDALRRAAKYNPARRKTFALADWQAVCRCVADRARRAGFAALAAWATAASARPQPCKADQDRLDAALCLLMAAHWRFGAADEVMCLGDGVQGYIATAVSPRTRAILTESAQRRGVGVDRAWPEDAVAAR